MQAETKGGRAGGARGAVALAPVVRSSAGSAKADVAGSAQAQVFEPTGDLFRLLVDSVQDYAIFLLDPTGHVESWNAGAQRIKGYRPAEIIGKHFSVFYTPEDIRKGVPAHGLATATREGHWEAEGWRVRKDGTRLWASVVIT